MRTARNAGLALCITALAVTACSSSGSSGSSGSAAVASGGTFTFAMADDPGNLNPLKTVQTPDANMFKFLYDDLVHVAPNGDIVSGLATSWKTTGPTTVFTIRKGVTCSDGSPVTPSVIAEDFAYIKNPANGSPYIGVAVPSANFTYQANDAAGTFTLTLAAPFGFLLQSLAFFPIVCGKGAQDPASLSESASGSGPYTLSQAVPNSHYTLALRKGYTWGPGGASTDVAGIPSKVVIDIISSETTAANELLSGSLNAAVINGPDRKRLTGSGYSTQQAINGGIDLLFNENKSRVTSDPDVRKALTMTMNRPQVSSVVTEGLTGAAGTSLSPAQPLACDDSAAASSIPAYDPAAAAKLLTSDGWLPGPGGIRTKNGVKLAVTAPYLNTAGGNAPAMDLIEAAWQKLGVQVTLDPVTNVDFSGIVFATGDYDVSPITDFANPYQSTLTGLLAGPPPPTGINAGHVDNPQYNSLSAQALQTYGSAGCQLWVQAARALYTNADMLPVSVLITNWVIKGATFQNVGGRIVPTSIRMLAS
jgi:peptide/nickel transport system substrate-binding protein